MGNLPNQSSCRAKRAVRCVLLVSMVVCTVGRAQADQEGGPVSYKMVSADGKYVFVMFAKWVREHDSDEARLDPQNGLYRNDGSTTPLWTVDWIGNAFLPSDGIHLVRMGPWPGDYDAEALTFFANGVAFKRYNVRDLVDFPSLLPHSSSHFRWMRFLEEGKRPNTPVVYTLGSDRGISVSGGIVLDETAHTLTLETLHKDRFTFDLNTGEIVSRKRPVRRALLGALGMLALVYGSFLWRGVRRPAKRSFKHSLLLIAGFSAIVPIAMVIVSLWLISHVPHSWDESAAYNALQLFVWSWPFRFIVPQDTINAFFYPYGEIQTFLAWFITFGALGILHNRLVWMLRQRRAGHQPLNQPSGA